MKNWLGFAMEGRHNVYIEMEAEQDAVNTLKGIKDFIEVGKKSVVIHGKNTSATIPLNKLIYAMSLEEEAVK